MPLYEYACEKCPGTFEVTQKITEAPLAACPQCGDSVRKLISRTSFQLKGSGWYASDYKKTTAPEKSKDSESKVESTPKEAPKPKGGCGGDCH